MALEKIEIRNWVETKHCGIGFTNGDFGSAYEVPSIVFNDLAELQLTDGISTADTSGVYVTSFTGLGHAPVRYITSHSPNQDGDFVSGFRLEPREITLNLRVNGCDRMQYWEIRSALINGSRPNWERANPFGDPIVTGFSTMANVFGRGAAERGPHQLVVSVPQSDGTFVERATDVYYRDGLVFEPESFDDWDSFSVDDTLGLTSYTGFFYDPVHTEETITNGGSGIEGDWFPYYGSWHAFPMIIIEMDNASISASETVRDIDIYIAYPVEQRIRISGDFSTWNNITGDSTSIVIDLRPSAKRVYVVDDSLPNYPFYYPVLADITHMVDLTTTGINSDLVNFSIGPAQANHGGASSVWNYRAVVDNTAGANTPLPWNTVKIRYHETYMGI